MREAGHTVPRLLKPRQVWRYLAGYAGAMFTGFALPYGVSALGNTNVIVAYGLVAGPLIGFAIWAARRHRNLHFVVVGPTVAEFIVTVPCLAVIVWSEPEGEFARWFLYLALVVTVAVVTWVPACLAGAITVRIVRGRWTWPVANQCPVCDYDLRGLRRPTCPECGADCTSFAATDESA